MGYSGNEHKNRKKWLAAGLVLSLAAIGNHQSHNAAPLKPNHFTLAGTAIGSQSKDTAQKLRCSKGTEKLLGKTVCQSVNKPNASKVAGVTAVGACAGNAAIFCNAKRYNAASYQESPLGNHMAGGSRAWLETCSTINPSCVIDCSGLVDLGIYLSYGNNKTWTTRSMNEDHYDFRHIKAGQLRRGDLVEPNAGHVEIVDYVAGDVIYAFAAHEPYAQQAKEVGPDHYYKTTDHNFAYLRYINHPANS